MSGKRPRDQDIARDERAARRKQQNAASGAASFTAQPAQQLFPDGSFATTFNPGVEGPGKKKKKKKKKSVSTGTHASGGGGVSVGTQAGPASKAAKKKQQYQRYVRTGAKRYVASMKALDKVGRFSKSGANRYLDSLDPAYA